MKKLVNLFTLFFCVCVPSVTQEINLGHIYTYITQTPVVEQRQILTNEEIATLNVSDLPSVLEACGIQILSYGPYGLEQKPSIRGFTDETVRVVIDGFCVNNAQYGTFDFSTINTDDIEKIEIVRGGFTEGVSDEGAVGGVIYITTKKQTLGWHIFSDSFIKSYFNLAQPADTFGESAGINGQLSDSLFLKINGKATFAENKFLYINYRNNRAERKNADVIDGNFSAALQKFFGNGNSLSFSNIFYGGKKNTPGSEKSLQVGLQKDYDNNFSIQLVMPETSGKKIKLENGLNWLCNNRFYDQNTQHSEHYVNTIKYSLSADFYGSSFFKEICGFTFDYTHLDSTDDGLHHQFSGTLKTTSIINIQSENRKNLFSVSVPLAFKFCNNNMAFTPKLGLGLKTPVADIFIDGYRMVQFPNMDDLYWDDGIYKGNPDLIPESGWGGDLSVNFHNDVLPLSLSVFSNYYENKIQWSSETNSPQNIASAFYFGVDFRFQKSFWEERLLINGSGEYLYTKLLDKSQITYGKKIMFTPDFVASLSAALKLNDFNFVIDGSYVGKRYISNLNIYYLEPYFLLNASAQMKIECDKFNLTPYLRLDNILNWDYESVPDYPMPGISGTLGIKIQFN